MRLIGSYLAEYSFVQAVTIHRGTDWWTKRLFLGVPRSLFGKRGGGKERKGVGYPNSYVSD